MTNSIEYTYKPDVLKTLRDDFAEHLLDSVERWVEQYPDKYVNPNMLCVILYDGVEGYTDKTRDNIDQWVKEMWEV
jgi:hypothetical protein